MCLGVSVIPTLVAALGRLPRSCCSADAELWIWQASGSKAISSLALRLNKAPKAYIIWSLGPKNPKT